MNTTDMESITEHDAKQLTLCDGPCVPNKSPALNPLRGVGARLSSTGEQLDARAPLRLHCSSLSNSSVTRPSSFSPIASSNPSSPSSSVESSAGSSQAISEARTPSTAWTSPFFNDFINMKTEGCQQVQESPNMSHPSKFISSSISKFSPRSPSASSNGEHLHAPSGFEFIDFGDEHAFHNDSGPRRSFDWEVYGPDSPHSINLTRAVRQVFKRRLGPTEVSYYLGSRGEGAESGVNDMYLHIGFRAKSHLMNAERLLDIWTEITLRHHLLASSVEYYDVDEVRFVYERPTSIVEARRKAKTLMEIRTGQDPKVLLDHYLNGPRTLSDERLSYLVISTPEEEMDAALEQEYDMYLFSTHFLGDGMALHTTANEIFTLLAEDLDASAKAESAPPSTNIEATMKARLQTRELPLYDDDGKQDEDSMPPALPVEKLAQAMESKLVSPDGWGRMAWAAARVEYNRNQQKLIGGHTFTRAKLGERKTLVPTIAYDTARTKKILASCKTHGTTMSHAVFALANIAYIRSTPDCDKSLPMMIYSALNMRGNLKKDQADWYHIAIGYYNIILSSFIPRSIPIEQTFWNRASIVRKQTSAVVKSKWLIPRSKLMALERERRSIGFEREDERKRIEKLEKQQADTLASSLQGLGITFGSTTSAADGPNKESLEARQANDAMPTATVSSSEVKDLPSVPKQAPNAALMGLSMLGNLDALYAHKMYTGLELHTLTTGSRQRPGAILLFAYTFAGKFWLSLGYDSNGFKEGVIDSWWTEMQRGVDEFLLGN